MSPGGVTHNDPVDCNPPGSSLHGILQAIALEWVAIPFSKVSYPSRIKPGSPALQADSLSSEPPGKPGNQNMPSPNLFFGRELL